jgi:enterochelin esterase family protein
MVETDRDGLLFTLRDRRYRRVALLHELRRPRSVPFERDGDRWLLRWTPPGAERLEYLVEIEHRDGRVETGPDPENPLRVTGVFGDKSVAELPDYAAPPWAGDADSPPGDLRSLTLPSRLLRTELEVELWSAADSDPAAPLPLLLVHDGPQYAEYSLLLRLLDHLVAFGELPPLRAALLPPPGDRNESYSASTRYARALTEEWLPQLLEAAPTEPKPVLAGASLGALAALHAHWVRPDALGGLFLQSGSYFRRRFDRHESQFGRFARITRFVSTAVNGRSDPPHIPVTFTVGAAEENLENNRVVAEALQQRGWDARLVEHRDAHNWVSWRDALHPHLADLLVRAGAG